MKIVLKVLLLGFVLVACNSNDNKKQPIEYPEKTDFNNESSALKSSIEQGKLVYNDLCITCHMADGKGATKIFPPLAQSDYLKNNQEKSIIGIKKGMNGEMVVNGITYNSVMAPMGLTNQEVADVMNYINNSWGNKFGDYISTEDVVKILKK